MRARLGSAASEAQIRWWTDELMGKTDQRSALRRLLGAHRHGPRRRPAAHHRADADRDHDRERACSRSRRSSGLRGASRMRACWCCPATAFTSRRSNRTCAPAMRSTFIEQVPRRQAAAAFARGRVTMPARSLRWSDVDLDQPAAPFSLASPAQRCRRGRDCRKPPIRTGRCASLCRSRPVAAPTSSRVSCKRICSKRWASRSWSRTAPAPPAASAPRSLPRRMPTATRS